MTPKQPAHLPKFREWLEKSDGKAVGTSRIYARFLVRCAEHYGEVINERTVTSDSDAQAIIDRVRQTVSRRDRWAKGTFNRHDVPDNLTPALRAYVRFIQAVKP